jgi:hypothetical protein
VNGEIAADGANSSGFSFEEGPQLVTPEHGKRKANLPRDAAALLLVGQRVRSGDPTRVPIHDLTTRPCISIVRACSSSMNYCHGAAFKSELWSELCNRFISEPQILHCETLIFKKKKPASLSRVRGSVHQMFQLSSWTGGPYSRKIRLR